MPINLLIFLCMAMIFCHIIDDYFIQGMCLSNLKQKSWWNENAPQNQYKNDYMMALFCHAFSWTFMIMLPLAIASGFALGWLWFAYPINTLIHMYVDDLKANRHKINLWQDQSIHFTQILITFTLFALFIF